MGEQGAGATEPDHDFVGDQMDPVPVAQGTSPAQILRVVHHHPAGALHQWLDDQRGDRFMPSRQHRFQSGRGAAGDIGGCLSNLGLTGIGRRDRDGMMHQRSIGFLVQTDIADPQRTQRLAMIATGQTEEFLLAGLTVIAPIVMRHFQGDFHRRRTVRGVETMAQLATGLRGQPLRQFHHRRVGESGQNHMFEPVKLILHGGVDTRVGMAE